MTARRTAILFTAMFVCWSTASFADGYPIRISHAFGETVISQKPERVASVAWANHEVPLALGVVPVGFAAVNFGDDNGDGLLPWVEQALNELGASAPNLFDEGDGIDFEAVAASQPDVILAAYSGLSRADYDKLSKIAPVVAYPKFPWSTGWRQMIRLNSSGMGMADEGEALIARLEGEIARTVAAHPEFVGTTAMFITHLNPMDLSTISYYTDNDPRVQFFHDLGFSSPKQVTDASKDGTFSGKISAERIDELADVDIMVSYGGTQLIGRLSANILTSKLSSISRGSFVLLGNNTLGTAANPTPLSISWVLDDYADLLAKAVAKIQ